MTKILPISIAILFVIGTIRPTYGQSSRETLPAPPVQTPQDYVPPGPPEPDSPLLDSCGYTGDTRVFTAETEYMLWTFLKRPTPTILETTNFLSASNVSLLNTVGDEDLFGHAQSGARLTLGYWLTESNMWTARNEIDCAGVEARLFFVGRRSFTIRDNDSPAIVRPFFDVTDHAQSGVLIAAPGFGAGSIASTSKIDIWGGEASVWKNLYYNPFGTTFGVYGMAGFRYLGLNSSDDISHVSVINQNLSAFPQLATLAGNRIVGADSFVTHNHFYGGEVGVRFEFNTWLMIVDTDLRAAVGTTTEDLKINGSQVRTLPNGTSVTSAGDLFALPSNIGQHHHSQFSQVPEVDLKFKFPVGCHCTLVAGLSAVYWTHYALASRQIEQTIDIAQIPNFPPGTGATPTGIGLPSVFFHQSDLWLVGVSGGAEFRW
jgi:hypothetical protein